MNFLFHVSGVEAPLWLPPVVAFSISFFTSMAGVSGAFLLLPFQVSFLHFDSPAVSPTNMVFNITGIPGAVYRYLREGRLVWPLTLIVVAGTLPGVMIGIYLRLTILSDPAPFKMFAGCVLLYIGVRLLGDAIRTLRNLNKERGDPSTPAEEGGKEWSAKIVSFNMRELLFRFQEETYRCATQGILLFSLLVGVVGGAYGIGGGALVAPVLVVLYRLPVHAVAGATLMGTFTTSVAGVLCYQFVSPLFTPTGNTVGPDWLLGVMFGIGGLAGMYLGARLQRFVPPGPLKLMLSLIVLFVSVRYVVGFFLAS